MSHRRLLHSSSHADGRITQPQTLSLGAERTILPILARSSKSLLSAGKAALDSTEAIVVVGWAVPKTQQRQTCKSSSVGSRAPINLTKRHKSAHLPLIRGHRAPLLLLLLPVQCNDEWLAMDGTWSHIYLMDIASPPIADDHHQYLPADLVSSLPLAWMYGRLFVGKGLGILYNNNRDGWPDNDN